MAKEIHERDGIRYEVEAAQRDGWYVAFWKCQACRGIGGETLGEYPQPDEAISAAKALLFSVHHSHAHSGLCGPKR